MTTEGPFTVISIFVSELDILFHFDHVLMQIQILMIIVVTLPQSTVQELKKVQIHFNRLQHNIIIHTNKSRVHQVFIHVAKLNYEFKIHSLDGLFSSTRLK